jgi:tetratricopeptide (TPR) repeat protein
MKRRIILCVLAAVMAVLAAPAAWGQLATFKGKATDSEGKPIANAQVQITSRDTGRKYELKTDKGGNYYSLGIQPGFYNLKLLKDGQLVYTFENIQITLAGNAAGETVFNIDMKKAEQQSGITEAQKKQVEETQKENTKIKGLNDLMAQANAAAQAGNFDEAIQAMTAATQLDPTRDILWFKLADAERLSAAKIAAPADKTARFQKAAEDFKKAIAIKPSGPYYNNLGEVQVKTGDTAAAITSYAQAAQIDPANAGQYYFNEGAVLTNTGKVDEATQAFDKAIQADPNRAEAYYQKAMNLLNKATIKDNKMQAPPGTEEALKKYLELQPTGEHAEVAKEMLAQLGASVETSFGKGKTKTKK